MGGEQVVALWEIVVHPAELRRICFHAAFSLSVIGVAATAFAGDGDVHHRGSTVVQQKAVTNACDSHCEAYPVLLNGLLGFINGQGEFIIQPAFSPLMRSREKKLSTKLLGHDWTFRNPRDSADAPPFGLAEYHSGFAGVTTVVCSEQQFGFVRRDGTVLFSPQFDLVSEFRDGIAWFAEGLKLGMVNEAGKILVPASLDDVAWFSDGLAAVEVDGKWGFIDRDGRMVIPCKFQGVGRYDRYAAGPLAPVFENGLAVVRESGKMGLIDRQGRYVVEPQRMAIGTFCDGRARVAVNQRVGFIDCRGRMIVEPIHELLSPKFSEGFATVGFNGKEGCINLWGEIVIPATLDDVGPFHEGVARASKDGKWGFIDHGGRFVIEPRFLAATDFEHGLAAVIAAIGKWGVIDVSGEFVVPAEYDAIGIFEDGIAVVRKGDWYGAISDVGELPVPAQYAELHYSEDQFFGRTSSDKWCVLARDGRVIVPAKYDWVDRRVVDNRRVFRDGRKFGYLDDTCRVVVPAQFDFAERFERGLAKVSYGAHVFAGTVSEGKWGYIDPYGGWVWEPTN